MTTNTPLFLNFCLLEVRVSEIAVRIHHNEWPNSYLITADCSTKSPLPVTKKQIKEQHREWKQAAVMQGYTSVHFVF